MIQEFDLHCHSEFSDGTSKISEIEEYCIRNNLVIALTDHNEIRGSVKLIENNKIPTIPGIEILTKEGLEILVYFNKVEEMEAFFKEQIEPFKSCCIISPLKNSLYNILAFAKQIDTFISIPHPYGLIQQYILRKLQRKYSKLMDFLVSAIDAIEVYNGHVSAKQSTLAGELRESYHKKITVGSDAHELKYYGYTTISFNTNGNSLPELFLALRENEYKIIKYTENKKRYIPISKFYIRNLFEYITHGIFSR